MEESEVQSIKRIPATLSAVLYAPKSSAIDHFRPGLQVPSIILEPGLQTWEYLEVRLLKPRRPFAAGEVLDYPLPETDRTKGTHFLILGILLNCLIS
jgi:hypothetical protein